MSVKVIAGLILAAVVIFMMVIASTGLMNHQVTVHEPIPTPIPTPGPDVGYRSIAAFTTLHTQYSPNDFPASERTNAQVRHITAPGCGSHPSGTRLYYAYTYPASLGPVTVFGFSTAFNDVNSLVEQTGYTDDGVAYRIYTTPQLLCNVVGGHRIDVLP